MGMSNNVPVQSLIDHIKTAIDVDPWAKEMVENLLKEQEHRDKMFHALEDDWKRLKELLKEHEEVVLCKDCKYKGNSVFREDGTEYIVCWNQGYGIQHPCVWFCADGERKEGK